MGRDRGRDGQGDSSQFGRTSDGRGSSSGGCWPEMPWLIKCYVASFGDTMDSPLLIEQERGSSLDDGPLLPDDGFVITNGPCEWFVRHLGAEVADKLIRQGRPAP